MNSRVLLSHRARRIFIWLHLWLGLILGLWFSLIGISGSVLTWRTEIGAWELARRFPIATPAPGAKILSLDAATAKLQGAAPDLDMKRVSAISPPQNALDSYKFTIGSNRKKADTIFLDSYSGQILGTAPPRSTNVYAIQNFHQRLIAGMRGYVFNGFLTVLGIPLLLSGLWLWWPRNIKQLRARTTLKSGAPIHRRLYDLHNVLGISLYGVLLVTTVTGALLVKNHLQRDGLPKVMAELRGVEVLTVAKGAKSAEKPEGSDKDSPKITPNGERMSNDALLGKARVAAAGAAITRVSSPRKPDDPFTANYAVGTGFNAGRTIALDPYNGKVLSSKTPAVEANNVIRGLHLGDFGGVLLKIIYTLTGLMPLGLFVTGAWLWARKKFKNKSGAASRARTEKPVAVETA